MKLGDRRARLTEEQVLDIRLGLYTQRHYAEKYDVSLLTIFNVVSRRTWKNV